MGSLLDCIKGVGTGRKESSSQHKARSRHALSSVPQWIPPSPSFPVLSHDSNGVATAGQRGHAADHRPHQPSWRDPVNPLVVGPDSLPCSYDMNPLAARPAGRSHSNSMPHPSPCHNGRHPLMIVAQSSPKGCQSNNNFPTNSDPMPCLYSSEGTSNPLFPPIRPSSKGIGLNPSATGSLGDENYWSKHRQHPVTLGPTNPQLPFQASAVNTRQDNSFQPVSAHEDWSLYTEGKLEFGGKPRVVRKLFSEDSPSENSPPSPDFPLVNDRSASKKHSCEVDVNYANVHELCAIGFTREQAECIVTCRVRRRQHFQSKSELKAILQIDEETWQRVKSRVTLVPTSGPPEPKGTSESRSKGSRWYAASKSPGTRPNTSSVASSSSERAVHRSDVSKLYSESGAGVVSIDLNSCNMQELCAVGLGKSQATAVVEYRVMTGGAFKSKEDLRSVPGISEEAYMLVQSKLTVVPPGAAQRSRHSSSGRQKQQRGMNSPSGLGVHHSPNTMPVAGIRSSHEGPNSIPPSSGISSDRSHEAVPCLYRSPRTSLGGNTSSEHIDLTPDANRQNRRDFVASFADQDEKFQTPTRSPVAGRLHSGSMKTSPRLTGGRAGGVSLRIASWNLQVFNEEKVSRPGVLEVVCSTIVQHGFDIIAVQEVGSKSSLEKVCQELNNPSLPKVQSLGANERRWDHCVSAKYTGRMYQGMEYNGFLWNKCSGVTLDGSGIIDTDLFVRKPFVGTFMLKGVKFVVISMHLKAENWGGKDRQRVESEAYNLPFLVQSIDQGGSDVVLLGDFNLPPSSACFQPLFTSGYTNILADGDCTNISAANPVGNKCYDNIWVSSNPRRVHYDERCGVVRRNLSIPPARVGGQSYMVSDHCPIWASFVCT